MLELVLALTVLVTGLHLYFNRPAARAARHEARLERGILAQDPRPPQEARAALARQLQALGERFPNQSRRWYLERLLADTRRSRR